jgi:hypothetical protein
MAGKGADPPLPAEGLTLFRLSLQGSAGERGRGR